MDGIFTLANDAVYDQLVALLNSIEAMLGTEMPVCIYPYDDRTTKIAAEIAQRPHVQLYQDMDSIQEWDRFARSAWEAHPRRINVGKRSAAPQPTDLALIGDTVLSPGPFDRFLYMDADTL
jgi:hypothetical protein